MYLLPRTSTCAHYDFFMSTTQVTINGNMTVQKDKHTQSCSKFSRLFVNESQIISHTHIATLINVLFYVLEILS